MSPICLSVALVGVAAMLAAWLAILVLMSREFMAAHGAFEHVCNGTMHIDRFLGLCADFGLASATDGTSASGCGASPPYHYCSGPLNSTELAALMAPSWPCYAASNLTEDVDCRAVVVLSRRNDGLGAIIISSIGSIVTLGLLIVVVQMIIRECQKPPMRNSVLVHDYLRQRRNESWYDAPGTYKVHEPTKKYGS